MTKIYEDCNEICRCA